MLRFIPILKLEEIKDGQGAGASGNEPKTEQAPAQGDTGSQAEGDQFDDFGYPITKEEGDKKPEGSGDKKSEVPKEEPTKIENPSTGYGDEPPKIEDAPPEKKEDPKKDDIDLGFEVNAEGVPAEELSKLKSFLKKHNASKELAQELIDQRKQEIASIKAEQEAAEKEMKLERDRTRVAWHKELKDDPNFGGDKFGFNVLRAEKVVEEFMPNTKKRLTETKAMLPPYVMRDLVKLADHLYSTEKLVQGDPTKPNNENAKDEDDPLAFYNS